MKTAGGGTVGPPNCTRFPALGDVVGVGIKGDVLDARSNGQCQYCSVARHGNVSREERGGRGEQNATGVKDAPRASLRR